MIELIQQKKVFDAPFFNGMAGLQVAIGMMDDSIDEVLAVLESLEDPASKAIGYIEASKKLGGRNRARCSTWPSGAPECTGGEGAGWYPAVAHRAGCRAVPRPRPGRPRPRDSQGRRSCRKVACPRGALSATHAARSPKSWCRSIPRPRWRSPAISPSRCAFDRHHGNIAHELANRDPARAERVLALVKDQLQRELYTVRVVYRMAAVDLARARQLAESISDESIKGFSLGMMALGLSQSGKPSAKEILEAAYESLEGFSRASQAKSNSLFDLTSIAAVLLPVAELVDPELVDEYLWRCLALRKPNPWQADASGRIPGPGAVPMAMMLARYDRAIARSLIEPLTQETGPSGVYLSRRGELHAAAAVIDPSWAVALVEALREDPDLKIQSPKNSARLAVATVLGRSGEQRFRKLQGAFLLLWVPDIEDVWPYE